MIRQALQLVLVIPLLVGVQLQLVKMYKLQKKDPLVLVGI